MPNPIAKTRFAIHGTKMKAFTVPNSENAERRLAQPRSLFEHRLEDRREVAGRTVDDLQHLGGRGLLRQRLVTLCFALGKFSLTLGKLTFKIGCPLLGIG
jgi:hypothetical protein